MIYEAKGNESNGVSRQINQTGVSCQINKLKVSRLKPARGCVAVVQIWMCQYGTVAGYES